MTTGRKSGHLRRRAILVIAPASALLLGLAAFWASQRHEATLKEPVSKPSALTPMSREWEVTSEGDFEQSSVKLIGTRIRLRCATRGTQGGSAKVMGVRRCEEIDLGRGTRISVDLDWNRQANGSGMSAGIVLAPAVTQGNPFALDQALWLEYVGIPPGHNGRRVIAMREEGDTRYLDTEGWPESNRQGRKIGLQKIVIEIGADGSVRFFENGELVCGVPPRTLKFKKGYLYLQVSSRSNYPPREIFFDGVKVETP
jgi:hypothetical protein